MAQFRIHRQDGFTMVDNALLRNRDISLKAKGLLSVMLSLPPDWDYSINGLVAICRENETAVKGALKELKTYGYLNVSKHMPGQTGSGRIEYTYDVYASAADNPRRKQEPGNQPQEKQGTENLALEFQGLENQGQYNKDYKIKTTKKEELKKDEQKKSADALPSDDAVSLETEFDILWKLYPKKQGKSNAERDYIKARKDKKNPTTFEAVKEGLERYLSYIKTEDTPSRYVKQGSTWFHQRCWEDEYESSGAQTSGRRLGPNGILIDENNHEADMLPF